MSGSENNDKLKFDNDKYLEGMSEHIAGMHGSSTLDDERKAVLIFALGRAYMLCQLLGLDSLGPFNKLDFKQEAERLGAKID